MKGAMKYTAYLKTLHYFVGFISHTIIIRFCYCTVLLHSNKNKRNGVYVCCHKHNYILCSVFTITRHNYMFQPSVLALFRLYVRNLSISYTNVCGEFTVCGVGWV